MKQALLVLWLVGIWSGAAWAAEEPTAHVKSVSGAVSVQRGETQLTPVAGDKLELRDVLRTGGNGAIGISFVDGTRLSLGPSSEVALNEYMFTPLEGKYSFNMLLRKGSAAYSSGKLGKLAPEAVKISTPQATIGVRGTTFVIKVN